MRKIATSIPLLALLLTAIVFCSPRLWAVAAQVAPPAIKTASFLGTVQMIDGHNITVKNDAGATMAVQIQDGARLLRIEPGQTSLQNASPFSLSDLQVGDRVLVRGSPSDDGKQIAASTLVAIKKADIAQQQQQQQEAWQSGVGGIVKSVDPAAGTIIIPSMPGNRVVTIQTTKTTIIRRYAPGSVKFDDAKPATLDDIKPGDQVRARGVKSADGLTFTADEIVGGTFHNIAGLITSVDPAASTVTLRDLATKQPVVIRVTSDSELKKLDPMVAQRLAVRMKGAAGRPGESGGGGDPQQLLARSPTVALKDFIKGSAVMLVATEGNAPGSLVAVTMVGGVEPMLQASPSGSQDFLSSAWSLGGGGGEGGESGP